MTRLEFLKQEVCWDRLLEQREGRDCSEYVVANGGDVCHYRVYGDSDGEYFIGCKRIAVSGKGYL